MYKVKKKNWKILGCMKWKKATTLTLYNALYSTPVFETYSKLQHLATVKLTLIGVCSKDNRLNERLQVMYITSYFHSNAYDFSLIESVS